MSVRFAAELSQPQDPMGRHLFSLPDSSEEHQCAPVVVECWLFSASEVWYLSSGSALLRVGHSLLRSCSRTEILALEGEDVVGVRAWLGFCSFSFTKPTIYQRDGLGRGLFFEGGCGRHKLWEAQHTAHSAQLLKHLLIKMLVWQSCECVCSCPAVIEEVLSPHRTILVAGSELGCITKMVL